MAKKKKKSVLDYDPLAWLNESESEQPKESSDEKKSIKKEAKKVVKKAVNKTPVKKKKVVKKSDKKTVKKIVKPVTDAMKNNDIEKEDDGFGFFADVSDVSVEKNESEDGFGFFTQNETVVTEPIDQSSDDDGFGFFTDEPESVNEENKLASEDNDGFGFFSNDDDNDLEAVNMEVLDISKDDAINLGTELTIKTVTEVKGQLIGLLAADEDIVINADEMIKIDTAGLQLLYSLKETLSKTGHHIKWIGTSTVINDSAEIIGMPILAPKSKEACFGFFEENMPPKDAEDGSSGFF